jgi:alanine dehydrogenase
MPNTSNIKYSDFYTSGQLETLAETLMVDSKKQNLSIGIPKENILSENRIGIVPHSVVSLVGGGYNVVVESGAGLNSFFTDHDFSESGAAITESKEEVFKCNIIIKTAPPTKEELDLMLQDQILISPLLLPLVDQEYLDKLQSKRITAIALEYLQSQDGSFPILRVMSEIAGMSVMLTAGQLLKNQNGGRAVLLGGVSGVPPAKVVILGAGIVALYAVKTAISLGASVRIFDNDITKIMRLQSAVGRQLHSSSMNPKYLSHQLRSADVIIGALHSKSGRSPIVITEDMVSKMKEGSIIIDVSIDQGGCIETSEVTSHDKPIFKKHGVIHYCVPNIASEVSRTASIAISNILTPIVYQICNYPNIESLLKSNEGILNGCYTFKGHLTNEYLAKKFSKKYTNLYLILTSII